MFKTIAALILGKLIFSLSRFLKLGGGFAAPGLYALKIDPDLVKNLINSKAKNIVVTGTNGKTTTAKLISHFIKTLGKKVIRNSSGSNLERGIASCLINHTSLAGGLDYDFGVWELDEFAFNSVAPKIKPDVVILLNAFRDQLDRYGEVDTVVNRWKETLTRLNKDTFLIVNNDDGNLAETVEGFKGKVITFGVKDSKILGERRNKVSSKAIYEAELLAFNLRGCKLKLKFKNESADYELPLPGLFNVYNFLASLACVQHFNIDSGKITDALKSFKPAFGRFEQIRINKFVAGAINSTNAYIFLIKNPVGATQVLETISQEITPNDSIFIALNDNFADGKDVSWIWDIEMERLKINDERLMIYVSGTRAYDMALRLKYVGIGDMQIEPDLKKAFDLAIKNTEGKLFILPTYTALLELQKILVKKGVKKEYWKE